VLKRAGEMVRTLVAIGAGRPDRRSEGQGDRRTGGQPDGLAEHPRDEAIGDTVEDEDTEPTSSSPVHPSA
jgi:hypothetical protein